MKSNECPNAGIILVAPGSVLRTLVTQMLAQKEGAQPAAEPFDEDADIPRIAVEPLSQDTLEQLSLLIEGTSTVPILLFCEEDTFRRLSGGSEDADERTNEISAAGEEVLNVVLSAVGGGEKPSPPRKIPVNAGFEGLLSTRELQVLELLGEGASNKRISAALSISPNTVYTHVRHIQGKLKTANRTQTALLARTMLAWTA